MFAGQQVVSTMEDIQRLLAGWFQESSTEVPLPAAAELQKASAIPAVQDSQPAVAGPSNTGQAQATAAAQTALTTTGCPVAAAARTASASAASSDLASNYNLNIGYKRVPGTTRMEPHLAAVVVAVAAYSHVSPASTYDLRHAA